MKQGQVNWLIKYDDMTIRVLTVSHVWKNEKKRKNDCDPHSVPLVSRMSKRTHDHCTLLSSGSSSEWVVSFFYLRQQPRCHDFIQGLPRTGSVHGCHLRIKLFLLSRASALFEPVNSQPHSLAWLCLMFMTCIEKLSTLKPDHLNVTDCVQPTLLKTGCQADFNF